MDKIKIESVTIVKNPKGAVATLRYSDSSKDRIMSSPVKGTLYGLIDKHISAVLAGQQLEFRKKEQL